MAPAESTVTVRVHPEFTPFTDDELINRFTYHAPTGDQPDRYTAIREQALDFARTLTALCPPSSELLRALAHLDETVFNANAAIARRALPLATNPDPDDRA